MGRRAAEGGPAGGAPGRRNSRSAALLAAAVLTSCFPLIEAQSADSKILVTMEPSQPMVGDNLTLAPGGRPNFTRCVWSRNFKWIFIYIPLRVPQSEKGPGYTGRETVLPQCSLHVRNLIVQNSGLYAVRKSGSGFGERGDVVVKISDTHALSKIVVAGIVAGALAGAALIGVLLYYAVRCWGQRVPQRGSNSSLPVSAKQSAV